MAQGKSREPYVLGHSDSELARLERQAGFFGEMTRDVLERAGVKPGMRVLDIGCGVGDVTQIAASLVGNRGRVLGIDISDQALAAARSRANAKKLKQVEFRSGGVDAFTAFAEYDAIIGRFILIHLPDARASIARIKDMASKGTPIAFAELDLTSTSSTRPLPLMMENVERIADLYRAAGFEPDMGSNLYATFRGAGLEPHLIGHTRIGNSREIDGFDYLVESVRSLAPIMAKLGIATPEEIGLDTLRARLLAEAEKTDACIFYPRFIGAWARA